MQIGHQNDASTTRKVDIFLVKLEFSASKTSCLLPVCLLIFSRLHYFNCRFRGIKRIKYLTNFLLRSIIFQQRKTQKKQKDVVWFTTKTPNKTPQKLMMKCHKSLWWNTTIYSFKCLKYMIYSHRIALCLRHEYVAYPYQIRLIRCTPAFIDSNNRIRVFCSIRC